MADGWIKLHRKFSDWEWFNISEMVHLFIFLLVNANHQDGEWRGINIKRGQILTGLNSLNESTKISVQTLRTCLKRLEKTKEINIQSTNKYSIITICKYEDYQSDQQTTNKQTNKQLTSNQQTTNNKQEEEERKNEKKEYIYSKFYDSEIIKSKNNEKYIAFIKYIFGENDLNRKLNGLLTITEQLTFEQFNKILLKAQTNKVELMATVEKIENDKKYWKGKTSLYRTLNNWVESTFIKNDKRT